MTLPPKRVFLRINGRVTVVRVDDDATAVEVLEAIRQQWTEAGKPVLPTNIHVRSVFRALEDRG